MSDQQKYLTSKEHIYRTSLCRHEDSYTRTKYKGGTFEIAITYCRDCQQGFTSSTEKVLTVKEISESMAKVKEQENTIIMDYPDDPMRFLCPKIDQETKDRFSEQWYKPLPIIKPAQKLTVSPSMHVHESDLQLKPYPSKAVIAIIAEGLKGPPFSLRRALYLLRKLKQKIANIRKL